MKSLVENTKKDRRGLLKWLAAGLGVAGITSILKLGDVPKTNATDGDYLRIGATNTCSAPTMLYVTGAGVTVDAWGGTEIAGGLLARSDGKTPTGGFNAYALRTYGLSQFDGNIMPASDNEKSCGDATHRWKDVYAGDVHATNLHGTGDIGDTRSKWNNVYATNLHGTLASVSLSKFKQNIESPTDIDYLSAIPDPIYFNWKNSDDKKRHLGYVGDYLPEIAKTGEGYIEANSVTAILCGAVQQLKESVKQLKEENEQLRRKIEDN